MESQQRLTSPGSRPTRYVPSPSEDPSGLFPHASRVCRRPSTCGLGRCPGALPGSKTQHPVRPLRGCDARPRAPRSGREPRPDAPFGCAREGETAGPTHPSGVHARARRPAVCLHCAAHRPGVLTAPAVRRRCPGGTRGQVSWWSSRVAYEVPLGLREHPRRRSPKGEAKRRGLQRVVRPQSSCVPVPHAMGLIPTTWQWLPDTRQQAITYSLGVLLVSREFVPQCSIFQRRTHC
jgi:hypothetical protein